MHIKDLLNQSNHYNRNGRNQPFASNLASALEHQNNLKGSTMTGIVLKVDQEYLYIQHLLPNQPDLYNKVMQDKRLIEIGQRDDVLVILIICVIV